jgi:hypothetical protein
MLMAPVWCTLVNEQQNIQKKQYKKKTIDQFGVYVPLVNEHDDRVRLCLADSFAVVAAASLLDCCAIDVDGMVSFDCEGNLKVLLSDLCAWLGCSVVVFCPPLASNVLSDAMFLPEPGLLNTLPSTKTTSP